MTQYQDAVLCPQGPSQLPPSGLGSLTGLRFVFKDLFDVQGYVTGAGNPVWLQTHEKATHTSPLIEAFLRQGAECTGRVQTDELAYSLNGQNCHYGTPVNPKAPDCLPGGSSSGSAVSVARNSADFALGTDTGGSVRVPASYCGIFGLRPTLGKLSLAHAFELARSFDTAGLFARQTTVLKRVYQTLTGEAEQAAAERIGMLASMQAYQPRIKRLVSVADIHGISSQTLNDTGLTDRLAQLSELFRTVQGYEIIRKHGHWLSQYGHSLDPAITERVNWSRTISEAQYQDSVQQQMVFKQRFIDFLQVSGGVLVIPTTPGGPPKLNTPTAELAQYRSELMGLTAIAGLSGCPQLHIPVPDDNATPSGVSLIGPPDSEMTLLNTALQLVGEGEGL